jgi:hypothetical protein
MPLEPPETQSPTHTSSATSRVWPARCCINLHRISSRSAARVALQQGPANGAVGRDSVLHALCAAARAMYGASRSATRPKGPIAPDAASRSKQKRAHAWTLSRNISFIVGSGCAAHERDMRTRRQARFRGFIGLCAVLGAIRPADHLLAATEMEIFMARIADRPAAVAGFEVGDGFLRDLLAHGTLTFRTVVRER